MTDRNWYKSREKYEDEITVLDIYNRMSTEKQSVLHQLLTHAARRTLPRNNEANHLSEVFDTFDENEKLTTYYLINEAVLRLDDMSNVLKLCAAMLKEGSS